MGRSECSRENRGLAVVYSLNPTCGGESQPTSRLMDAGRTYCSGKGLEVLDGFSDEPAPESVERPGLLQAFDLVVGKPKVTHLVVSLSPSLASLPLEIRVVSGLLNRLGVQTEVLADLGSMGTDVEHWLDSLLAGAASIRFQKRSKRSRLEFLLSKGMDQLIINPPIGYRITSLSSGKRFISPDPGPAGIVRMAFELVANEENPIEDILKLLNERAGMCEFGHGYIDGSDLCRIIKNRSYLGQVMVTWCEWVAGRFPALIDHKTFAAARRRIAKLLRPECHDADSEVE